MSSAVDVVIVGAGVVGCAVASKLADGKRSLIVLEAGPRIGEGVTSRNSGVIHAGLYYPPESLKAATCIRGKDLLYDWVKRHSVPHRKLGKLIVASSASQLAPLDEIHRGALASGATGLNMLSPEQARRLEPGLSSLHSLHGALLSSETGIVDAYELTRTFMADAESRDAQLLLHTRVTSIAKLANGDFRLETTRGPIDASVVINAAGLHADEIAAMAGVTKYKIHPCRGDYFSFKSKTQFNHLIYPVKEKGAPGLGVHLTLDLQGRYRLGPDTQYVGAKDRFEDAAHKLDTFLEAARKLFGDVEASQLSYDTCGIRPKLRAPSDSAEKDFVIARDLPGLINLVGIESPGLTASLAIAERVLELLR